MILSLIFFIGIIITIILTRFFVLRSMFRPGTGIITEHEAIVTEFRSHKSIIKSCLYYGSVGPYYYARVTLKKGSTYSIEYWPKPKKES